MYFQFQFLSLYKVCNTKFLTHFSNKSTDLPITKTKIKSTKNGVLTSNIQIFYVIFFMLKINKINSTVKSAALLTHTKVSFFFLPSTKKNTIFLRAPYKNKLARLNILQIQYKFFMSFRCVNACMNPYNNLDINSLTNSINKVNFSSPKIKHTKTNIIYNSYNIKNFAIENFN